ncbi:MAG: YggU family protein [Thermoplasmata archaeon HGW-Thermoplasmata-1]|nr:MAG: YggU family protein [Thermoplasmata archaeon HGW-Thermoplasmata-1]
MIDLQEAVAASKDGAIVMLEVTPNAGKPIFPAGYNEWRKRILVRVAAEAEEGRANREIISLLASFFRVPNGAVTIKSGEKSSQKNILLAGVSVEAVRQMLEEAF